LRLFTGIYYPPSVSDVFIRRTRAVVVRFYW
jgi:hypothetical protein